MPQQPGDERAQALGDVDRGERDLALGNADRGDLALGNTDRGECEIALARAVRALARRDHSIESLRAKLERAGVSESARDAAVDSLTRAGYLDDERFALDRAAKLAARGYGDEWIRADLKTQGIPARTAEAAMAAIPSERERAAEQAARFGAAANTARTLRRRGFSEDALEGVLARTVAEES